MVVLRMGEADLADVSEAAGPEGLSLRGPRGPQGLRVPGPVSSSGSVAGKAPSDVLKQQH